MPLTQLTDASLLLFYNNLRAQVDAERHSQHQLLASDEVRQYGDSLQEELDRRRISFTPIQWR
jgi:hypothetical protein